MRTADTILAQPIPTYGALEVDDELLVRKNKFCELYRQRLDLAQEGCRYFTQAPWAEKNAGRCKNNESLRVVLDVSEQSAEITQVVGIEKHGSGARLVGLKDGDLQQACEGTGGRLVVAEEPLVRLVSRPDATPNHEKAPGRKRCQAHHDNDERQLGNVLHFGLANEESREGHERQDADLAEDFESVRRGQAPRLEAEREAYRDGEETLDDDDLPDRIRNARHECHKQVPEQEDQREPSSFGLDT
mmetsp:Transcript_61322/g.164977  ORF Transcript_61322/g.164977 Transcript_61322/m.164977 type:complete len:245 (-) Transcript_61322:1179-1913(-)